LYVYYANGQDEIERIAKDGSSGEPILLAAGDVRDLAVDGSYVYWLESSGLWWGAKNCAQPPCSKVKLSANTGDSLIIGSSSAGGQPSTVYIVQTGISWRIRRLTCTIQFNAPTPCQASDVYIGPANSSIGPL